MTNRCIEGVYVNGQQLQTNEKWDFEDVFRKIGMSNPAIHELNKHYHSDNDRATDAIDNLYDRASEGKLTPLEVGNLEECLGKDKEDKRVFYEEARANAETGGRF